MSPQETVKGFVTSKHLFGRSALVRDGNRLYYLEWQWTKHSTINDVIYLTAKQYEQIKKYLLSIRSVETREISEKSQGIVHHHAVSSRSYMRIKRYLTKNKLLKEVPKNADHNATGSTTGKAD
jgi:hypothetical protein